MERTTFIPIPASPDVYVHASEQFEHARVQPIEHNSYNRVHETVVPSEPPVTDEVVRIDNGDEYTLIPLGNDTFQIFKTADLVFNHIVIERQETPDQHNQKENVYATAESATDGRHFINAVPQTLYSNGGVHQEVFPARTVHNYPANSSTRGETLPASDSRPVQKPKKPKKPPANKPRKTEEKKEVTPIIFACRICDVTFSNEFSLDAHVQQHQIWKEKPENGSEKVTEAEGTRVDETKPNLLVLEGEYDSISGRGLFQCGICGKTFRNVGYIHIHLERAHDVAAGERIIARGKQEVHAPQPEVETLVVDEDDVDETHSSGRTTTTTKTANAERENEDGVATQHQCDKCHQLFPRLDLFLKHKLTHLKTFACEFCQKTYTAKKSLQNHLTTAHGEAMRRAAGGSDAEADRTVLIDL